MATQERSLSDYVATLKRRWRVASVAGGAVLLIFVLLAFGLPAVYEGSSTLLIEQQKIPDAMVQSTVATYANELLESVTQRVMSTENIIAIIKKLNLYEDRKDEPIDDLVAEFRANSLLVPAVAPAVQESGRTAEVTYAFTLTFQYPGAEKAAAVVRELSTLYTTANRSSRENAANVTTTFLETEATRLQTQLTDIENKLAQFRIRYGTTGAPESPLLNLQRLDGADREIAQIDQDLRSARERKDIATAELAQTARYRPVFTESGQPMVGGETRLATAQQELIAARAKYSENHPDVQRLKREIATLSSAPGTANDQGLVLQLQGDITQRQQELAAARQTYSNDHPDVVRLERTIESLQKQLATLQSQPSAPATIAPANNPVYLQLVTRIRSADEEIGSLSARRADLSSRLNQYRAGAFPSPLVEKEYNDLMRDYELLQTSYRDIRTKQTQATLAQKLESDDSGERLTIINPARVPISPVKPDRIMLLFLGFVLALAAALGAVAIADATDTTVRGRKDVFALLQMAPLAIIPYIDNRTDIRHRIRTNGAMAAAVGAAVLITLFILVL